MLATFLKGATASAPVSPIQYVGGHAEGFVGTTSNVTIFIDDLLGGLASAPAAGDLVIVYFGTGSTVDRNLVVSGYTEVVELYSSDTHNTNLAVAYKFMGGTPDSSFVLTGGTLSADDGGAVAVQVWRGVDSTTPLDVTRTTATGSNSVLCNPPAITPTTSGAIIVSGGAGASNAAAIGLFSSSDLTDFISETGRDTKDVTIGLGYKVWTSGSFDPAAFTFSTSDSTNNSWAAVTLALRPA
jgi:hypothetical protein